MLGVVALGVVVVLLGCAGVVEIAPDFVGAGGVAVAVPLAVSAGGVTVAPVAGGVGNVVSGIGTSGKGFDRMPATNSLRPVSDLLRYL